MKGRPEQRPSAELSEVQQKVDAFVAETAENSTKPQPSFDLPTIDIEDFYLIPNAENSAAAAQGRTVTIFLCGTCSNSDDYKNPRYFDGENISHTYTITEGDAFVDKIIVDGPGSGEKDADSLWVDYKKYSDTQGITLGKGVTERLQHILAVLKNKPTRSTLTDTIKAASAKLSVANTDKPITKINIVGWSRGAAAGITLANLMAQDGMLQHIPCNLILLDPVPGVGLSDKFNRRLSQNVNNCFVLYVKDERSAFFNPVVPDCPPNCHFYPILFPGGHAQVAGDDSDHAGVKIEGADLQGVGKIARYIIQHLLTYLGTKLDHTKISNSKLKDILKLYDTIKLNRHHYEKIAQRVPYTFNQLLGEERKVILGDDFLGNQYMSRARERIFPPHTDEHFDGFHLLLEKITKKADELVSVFKNEILEIFKTTSKLEPAQVQAPITKLLEACQGSNFLCRAISEELQTIFKPGDLNSIAHRHFDPAQLAGYLGQLVKGMISTHNRHIDIQALSHEIENDQAELDQKVSELTEKERSTSVEIDAFRRTQEYRLYSYNMSHSRSKKSLTQKKDYIATVAKSNTSMDDLDGIKNHIDEYNRRVDQLNRDVITTQDFISERFRIIPDNPNLAEEQKSCNTYVQKVNKLTWSYKEFEAEKESLKRKLASIDLEYLKAKVGEVDHINALLDIWERDLTYHEPNPEKLINGVVSLERRIGILRDSVTSLEQKLGVTLSHIQEARAQAHINQPGEKLVTQALQAHEAKYRDMLEKFATMQKTLSEQINHFKKKKGEIQDESTLASTELARMNADFLSEIKSLRNNLSDSKKKFQDKIDRYNTLMGSLKTANLINKNCKNTLTVYSLQLYQRQDKLGKLKEELRELLRKDLSRIRDEWSIFNSTQKTNAKINALGVAISSLDRINNLAELRIKVSTLINDDMVSSSRSGLRPLLYFSIFQSNSSTVKTNLTNFLNNNIGMRSN